MGKHHWKVEKQPEWYVKAVRKTIAALPGGYAEAAEWLDVTENALFNRLRADGDQIFPLGWAMVLQRAADTHYTVSYTHLTLPTSSERCRSRWSPYH